MDIIFEKKSTCCFTGHRPEKLNITEYKALNLINTAVENAISDGFTTFISGMARGIDIWAAKIILNKKENSPDIKLICAIPFKGFENNRNFKDKEIYHSIIEKADYVYYVCNNYNKSCFQLRNIWMVNNSERVIAFFNGEKGGTKNTIDYAKQHKINIINMLV